jgi:hypothetical protein
VAFKEIDEMIRTVDSNGNGKMNYSEFMVNLDLKILFEPPRCWHRSGPLPQFPEIKSIKVESNLDSYKKMI